MMLVIDPSGTVRCLYTESIDLQSLGPMVIRRASHVEPTPDGHWMADLKPVQGPQLGPFRLRSDALAAEERWLTGHRFTLPSG